MENGEQGNIALFFEIKMPAYAPAIILEIAIQNPIVHRTNDDKYTDYEIIIKVNNFHFHFSIKTNISHKFKKGLSLVRRRFSEFEWLRSWLVKTYKNEIVIPELPSKFLIFRTRFDEEVIKERCKHLQFFIQS